MDGKAADFTVAGLSVRTVCERIIDRDVPFQQLIAEGVSGVSGWVHLAIGEPHEHWDREVLTAKFSRGRATYTPGLPA